jgi:hypothetical protein
MEIMLNDSWLEKLSADVPTRMGRRLTLANRSKKGQDGRWRRQVMPNVESLEDRIALTATVTTVISSPDPSLFGQAVTFIAAVKTVIGNPVFRRHGGVLDRQQLLRASNLG